MPWACSEGWLNSALGLKCAPVLPSGLADGQWHTNGLGVLFVFELFETYSLQMSLGEARWRLVINFSERRLCKGYTFGGIQRLHVPFLLPLGSCMHNLMCMIL